MTTPGTTSGTSAGTDAAAAPGAAAGTANTRIRVGNGEPGGAAPYDVVIGTGLLGELPELLGPKVARVAIIHPKALAATAEAIRADLDVSYEAVTIEVPDAEEAKSVQVLAYVWSVLGQSGFTRTDAIDRKSVV